MGELRNTDGRQNNFGLWRLIFAALVIASHTPEIAYHDRSHELLTRAFGSISFGELAVDGFFLISGFLIAGSWLRQPSLFLFLRKRVARIVPAFAINFLVCIFIVAPLAGASLATIAGSAGSNVWALLSLGQPMVPGVFNGELLNGAAWTIAYEFRCYLLIALLGISGGLTRPKLLLVLITACFFGQFVFTDLLGHAACRLTMVYLIGVLLRLRKPPASGTALAIAWGGLILSLYFKSIADLGVAVFGGTLLFGTAERGPAILRHINSRTDASYGLYLYAWPIEELLYRYFPDVPIIVVGVITLVLAYLIGRLSWRFVESPVLRRMSDGGKAITSPTIPIIPTPGPRCA